MNKRSTGLILLTIALALYVYAAPARRAVYSVPLPKGDLLRFIVVGDAGTGDPHLHIGIASIARKMKVNAILLVGDNVYPCGVKSVDDPQWSIIANNFAESRLPVYPVLGNHDYGDPSGKPEITTTCPEVSPASQVRETGHLPRWIFPARNYALRSPLVDILMIDTQPIASAWAAPFRGSETASSELDWIKAALSESKGRWRIVAGHHTIFSSGIHGRANGHNQRNLRTELLPLLKAANVDLYACGHDHDAELLGYPSHHAGDPLFLVSGAGASSMEMAPRTAAGEPPTIFPPFPARPLVGFALLEVTPATMRITFYDGIGTKRSDTFTITQGR
jgi:tartrate-resistant acid phosphatase type 5